MTKNGFFLDQWKLKTALHFSESTNALPGATDFKKMAGWNLKFFSGQTKEWSWAYS